MGTSHTLLVSHLSLPPLRGCQSNLSAFFVGLSCHIASLEARNMPVQPSENHLRFKVLPHSYKVIFI